MWDYVIITSYWWMCYVGLCNRYVILVAVLCGVM